MKRSVYLKWGITGILEIILLLTLILPDTIFTLSYGTNNLEEKSKPGIVRGLVFSTNYMYILSWTEINTTNNYNGKVLKYDRNFNQVKDWNTNFYSVSSIPEVYLLAASDNLILIYKPFNDKLLFSIYDNNTAITSVILNDTITGYSIASSHYYAIAFESGFFISVENYYYPKNNDQEFQLIDNYIFRSNGTIQKLNSFTNFIFYVPPFLRDSNTGEFILEPSNNTNNFMRYQYNFYTNHLIQRSTSILSIQKQIDKYDTKELNVQKQDFLLPYENDYFVLHTFHQNNSLYLEVWSNQGSQSQLKMKQGSKVYLNPFIYNEIIFPIIYLNKVQNTYTFGIQTNDEFGNLTMNYINYNPLKNFMQRQPLLTVKNTNNNFTYISNLHQLGNNIVFITQNYNYTSFNPVSTYSIFYSNIKGKNLASSLSLFPLWSKILVLSIIPLILIFTSRKKRVKFVSQELYPLN